MNTLKLKTKKRRLKLFFISVVLIIIVIVIIFKYINTKASPIIINYASLEAQKLSSIIINKAISKHVTEKISSEEMFEIVKDDSGEIKAIDFNTPLINKFLTETTNSIQINMRKIEKGDIDALEFADSVLVDYDRKNLKQGIIYEISSGIIIGNPLLANVGPKIPVRIVLVGDAISNVRTKVKNYGINNALVEVYVNLKINEKVIVPFYSKNIKVETNVPVAMKLVTGTVPRYYANGIEQSTPSLFIPEEN